MARILSHTCHFVYVTARDTAEAKRIGRTVVEERLAACANVIDGMSSTFWWQGKIEEASEAVLILKTATQRLDDLTARVKALHSYDCPAIVAWPIDKGNADYFDWIGDETLRNARAAGG
jgi:periplasmic divalent cation tolerance protein